MTQLPLFAKQAAGKDAAALVRKLQQIEPKPQWPHGEQSYRQSVYNNLAKYGPPDMPYPAMVQITKAMVAGLLPGDFAFQLIRENHGQVYGLVPPVK